jgi:hypothetical protein
MTPPYAPQTPPGVPEHENGFAKSYLDEPSDFLTSDDEIAFAADPAKFIEDREKAFKAKASVGSSAYRHGPGAQSSYLSTPSNSGDSTSHSARK